MKLIKDIRRWWSGRVQFDEKIINYGYNKTIHRTTEVNIERDPRTGVVVAVWFRCMMLPFTDSTVDQERANEMRQAYQNGPVPKLVAVDVQVD